MNHCRRCDSDYEKPGTCNCFATQAGYTARVLPQPCQFCGKLDCRDTHVYCGDAPVSFTLNGMPMAFSFPALGIHVPPLTQ